MSQTGSDLPFLPLSERGEIQHTANRLPHREQEGRAYFLTFRLADSLPAELLDQWERERANWFSLHPEPWSPVEEEEYHLRFSGRLERALDEGHGSCVLRQSEIAEKVGDALAFFEGDRYQQLAWTVMPNHVHVLFAPLGEWTLQNLLHSWKSFTAKAINALLHTTGSLWQKDYFDRLIRDADHFGNCVRYIRRNPAHAHLKPGEFLHWESEWAKRVV